MRRAPRLFWVILVGLMLHGGVGCGQQDVRWHEATDQGRQDSFQPYRQLYVDGRPLATHVRRHSAMLLGGFDVEVESHEGGWRIRTRPSEHGLPYTGLAVPLTEDGYFLTAAHTVMADRPQLLLPREDDPLVEARIVWQSEVWRQPGPGDEFDRRTDYHDEATGIDLAILHAPVEWDEEIQWADARHLERGAPVVAGVGVSGWGQPAGGQFVRMAPVQPADPPIPAVRFIHSAPTGPGDSGGPVMLTDGRLIGITVGGETSTIDLVLLKWTRPTNPAFAVAPDPDAVMQIIERDREEHADTDHADTDHAGE